jgi:hypothetical protein
MNRIFPLSTAFVLALGLAPAIAGWPTEGYRTMVAAIQKSGNVVLYEGLPHQETEAAQLQAELKKG